MIIVHTEKGAKKMIKIDIEMPKTCNNCFCMRFYEEMLCGITNEDIADYAYNDTKPERCPLEEAK